MEDERRSQGSGYARRMNVGQIIVPSGTSSFACSPVDSGCRSAATKQKISTGKDE